VRNDVLLEVRGRRRRRRKVMVVEDDE